MCNAVVIFTGMSVSLYLEYILYAVLRNSLSQTESLLSHINAEIEAAAVFFLIARKFKTGLYNQG